MGRTCPSCPFWAGIDRFTHEPVMPPAPTMAPAEILADLSSDEPEIRKYGAETAKRSPGRGQYDPGFRSGSEVTIFVSLALETASTMPFSVTRG